MKILILDTSTEKPLVAICDGLNILFIQRLPPGFKSSTHLFSVIESGYQKVGFSTPALSAIAVTTGPGLYTGIRVGAAAAKGLAFPASLPLIGLNSLSGFVASDQGEFASVIDARVGGAYVLLQKRSGNEIQEISQTRFVPSDELLDVIGERPAIGPTLDRFPIKNLTETYADPAHLSHLAVKKFLDGESDSDLKLIYYRSPVDR